MMSSLITALSLRSRLNGRVFEPNLQEAMIGMRGKACQPFGVSSSGVTLKVVAQPGIQPRINANERKSENEWE